MSLEARIESSLKAALDKVGSGGPPKLLEALWYAVFPGGGRLRPRLVLEVAGACGEVHPELASAAAVAVELVHCASLVHDDMPCFDDAEVRRGRPSVHRAFGEAQALLVGDGLIVAAFEALGSAGEPALAMKLCRLLAQGSGVGSGVVAGQAWESEARIDVDAYHRAKTASLFEVAAMSGAVAAGHDAEAWRRLGTLLGVAYQVADDLADATGDVEQLGKPAQQDVAHGRPNKVQELGVGGALGYLQSLIPELEQAIPPCQRRDDLARFLHKAVTRLVPSGLSQRVA